MHTGGKVGSQNLFSSLALALLAAPGLAISANHALIMGVSDYPQQPLPGVKTDVGSARSLARQMNVPEANIRVNTDRELTLDGIRRALEDLTKRVKHGDQVFIYFSGHGTSYAGAAGRCEQALVTQDMQRLRKQEFQERIKPIVDKAAKSFVFLDTCFSGGVIAQARSDLQTTEHQHTAKFVEMRLSGDTSECGQPANVAGRSVRDFDVETANVTPNYYFLAASAPNQVAIDGGTRIGGYATAAFSQCAVQGSTADENGDGVITLDEATKCAQRAVDTLIAQGRRKPNYPFTQMTLTTGSGPGAGATPVALSGQGLPVHVQSTTRINGRSLLETLQRGADTTHTVELRAARTSFKIGTDFLELSLTSSRAGYVTLFSVGSSGKIFRLFPNRFDDNNRIEPGVALQLPRPDWRLRSRGPMGSSRFLAVVSSTPDRFAGLGIPDGPFSAMENTLDGIRGLLTRIVTPSPGCQTPLRDFSAENNPCATGYGAGVVDVQEVE